jgi:mono/diheme cytochrome c family protein
MTFSFPQKLARARARRKIPGMQNPPRPFALALIGAATVFVVLGGIAAAPPRSLAAPLAKSVWDSVYSDVQAARGDTVYRRTCVRCHTETLVGKDDAAPLTGPMFMANWNGMTIGDLYDKIRSTMPSDSAGTLKNQEVADVIAYVLKFDGFPAGKTELAADMAPLKEIKFEDKKP